jgi:hypothetical protein
LKRFLDEARRDPTILGDDLRYREIVKAAEKLDGTYIIRLFAETETGLRQFWDTIRDTNPRTRDLLDALAALRGIPDPQLANAHAVREYRNQLVHEREEEVEPVPVDEARGYLCHYFSYLPFEW